MGEMVRPGDVDEPGSEGDGEAASCRAVPGGERSVLVLVARGGRRGRLLSLAALLGCQSNTLGETAATAAESTTDTSTVVSTHADATAGAATTTGTATSATTETAPDPTTTTETTSSSSAECGDGAVQGDEACDDGNDDNTDECTNTCQSRACGDGFLHPATESCDDGNDDDMDACVMCKLAVCGDEYVWEGVEMCDDGNLVDSYDDCSNECKSPRIIFVTSMAYAGDLAPPIDGKSGIALADAHCQALAAAASLTGFFRAWISAGADGPVNRFVTGYKGAYKLVDGSLIAADWEALVSNGIVNPIIKDEKNNLAVNQAVWTNTRPDGTPGLEDCKGWTSAAPDEGGGVGLSSDQNGDQVMPIKHWTEYVTFQCNALLRLYCVQDEQG